MICSTIVGLISERRTGYIYALSYLILTLLGTGFFTVSAQDTVTSNDAMHLGVTSCAQSTCHGSNVAFVDSNVLQNEFRTWNELDPHAQAYKTLLTPESAMIAQKLAIESAANSSLCLNCHADNVAENLRGADFHIEDGVGCEACHGGAENYFDVHTKGGDHQANLNAGLYPSEQPEARAQLCVSCHLGNESDRTINHTIMGAGHPRLSFELNTFTSIQPAHYRVDEDYKQRKGDISEIQVWAVGQLVAAEQALKNIRALPRSGLFPELAHMDCLSCHEAMSKITWTKNPLTEQPAGALRYNDSNFMMSYQIALAVAPESADDLLTKIRAFLISNDKEDTFADVFYNLQQGLFVLKTKLLQTPISDTQGLLVLESLLDIGLASSHRDYVSAEQSAMAINSVLKVIDSNNQINREKAELLIGVDNIFDAVQDSENYQAEVFIAGLRKIKAALAR